MPNDISFVKNPVLSDKNGNFVTKFTGKDTDTYKISLTMSAAFASSETSSEKTISIKG